MKFNKKIQELRNWKYLIRFMWINSFWCNLNGLILVLNIWFSKSLALSPYLINRKIGLKPFWIVSFLGLRKICVIFGFPWTFLNLHKAQVLSTLEWFTESFYPILELISSYKCPSGSTKKNRGGNSLIQGKILFDI